MIDYRRRRSEQATIAKNYRHGDIIPRIEYTDDEVKTWSQVYKKLSETQTKYACDEYLNMLSLMGYNENAIPQAQDISSFLLNRTGFQLRPVPGKYIYLFC